MRLNKFIAQQTGISRRAADKLIINKQVRINGQPALLGIGVGINDHVTLGDTPIKHSITIQTYALNKPVGYVCSRNGQGSATIYELLPKELHNLKPIGRLDKDSSGLLLLTNDGNLAQKLTHPSFQKQKAYRINLHKSLTQSDQQAISMEGVLLSDGISKLRLTEPDAQRRAWTVTMSEGRNRQIRRTFAALGYNLNTLHRTIFGPYKLGSIQLGQLVKAEPDK